MVEPSAGMPFVDPLAASSGGSRGQVAQPCADAEADEAQSVTSGRSWQTSLTGLSLAETPDSLFATPAAHFGAGMAGRETPFATPAFDLSAAKAASAKPGLFVGGEVNGGAQESPVSLPDEAKLSNLGHVSGQLLVVFVARLLVKAVHCWLNIIQLFMLLLSVLVPSIIELFGCESTETHTLEMSLVSTAGDEHSRLASVDSDAAAEPALTLDAASGHGSPATAAVSLAEASAASDPPAAALAASPASVSKLSKFAVPSEHSEQGSTTPVGIAAAEAIGGPPCSEGYEDCEEPQQEAQVRLHGSCQYGEANLQCDGWHCTCQ